MDTLGDGIIDHVLADTDSDGASRSLRFTSPADACVLVGKMDALVPLPKTYSLEAMCLLASDFKQRCKSAKQKVNFSLVLSVIDGSLDRTRLYCLELLFRFA